VRSRVANLPARSVRYLEAGSGTPVVLLHAFPLNAEQWLPQLARVPPGVRVVAPDLRGFAGSEPFAGLPSPSVSMDIYAADVLELMAHLEMPRAVVCGLSMGGYVALAMIRKAPARVSGLLLADTRATADTVEGRAGRDRMLELVAKEGPSAVAVAMVPKLLGETTRREQRDLADAVTRLVESSSKDGIAAAIRAMKDRPDSTSVLASIACPASIVCGDEDMLTPVADSEAMHRAIAGSELVVLPRAGHLSNLENAAAFNDVLYRLARH
jgi:pimeloyl-ACP methyl ester carboxylesterase